MKSFYLFVLLFAANYGYAQKKDTVIISPATILTQNLPMGNHKYLVYFKKDKDSSSINFQMWNLSVKKEHYKGKPAIIIDQFWEDNTEIIHRVHSVSDVKDFKPIYQTSWWKARGTTVTDFEVKTATFPDQLFRKNPDSSRKVALNAFLTATNEYALNWHLDLETFSMLPFKEGVTFGINYYDAGFSAPKVQYYTVIGSATFEGVEKNKTECWLLNHESPGNKETFWISKKTKEVLKLEQQAGKLYRFKIKIPV
ncbi:hypothetical protein WG904_16190 [Pedobacter sp. Du54]|uniref:DUF3108 domain-containing protein n=1 Tax=Pedobacter anseongensis TaxID=3133439 RepID=UPI0030A07831